MSGKQEHGRPVREAVGVFVDTEKLHQAADEVFSAGFDPAQIGLLSSEETIKETLGEYYEKIAESADESKAPNTAFVAKESVGDTVHAMIGALSFAGTTVAGAAMVASAAVLGGGLLAAVAGATTVAAMGTVLSLIDRQSDAEHLEQQVDEGHLLLFVRLRDAKQEALARSILSKHTPIEVLVVETSAREAS